MMQIEEAIIGLMSLSKWNGTRSRKQWVYEHSCRQVNGCVFKWREIRLCFEKDFDLGGCSHSSFSICRTGNRIKVKATDGLEGYWRNFLCKVPLRFVWFQSSFSAVVHLWAEVVLWIPVSSIHSFYINVYSCWPFGLGIELECVWSEVGSWLGDLWSFSFLSSLAWKVLMHVLAS